jgi:hypothetical protein
MADTKRPKTPSSDKRILNPVNLSPISLEKKQSKSSGLGKVWLSGHKDVKERKVTEGKVDRLYFTFDEIKAKVYYKTFWK